MLELKLTTRAIDDLIEIAEYGLKVWGKPKRDAFIDELYQTFSTISENPYLGIARDEIKNGYRCRYAKPYTIFYIILDDRIEIIGVIHQSRETQTNLT